MEKILENGTEVLIFNYIAGRGLNQDIEHYIKGTIINSGMSDDLSYHGSPWYVINYTVLGEDEKLYFGNYGSHTLGDSFFMTEDDYISLLNRKISFNEEKIKKIEDENKKLEGMIKKIKVKGQQKALKFMI